MHDAAVIALADELHAHLERGDLAGLGAVDLGPSGTWADAELVARILLADAAHRLKLGVAFERTVPGASRAALAEQLRQLDQAIHRHLARRGPSAAAAS
jgi:hypothetical protein